MGTSLSILLSKHRVENERANMLASQLAQSSDPNATRVEKLMTTRAIGGRPVAVLSTNAERRIDTLLQENLRVQESTVDGLTREVENLRRYTRVFGTKGQNTTLSQKLTSVIEKLAQISIDPSTVEKKFETVHAIKGVTDTLNYVSDQIMTIRKDIDEMRDERIKTANSLITDIAHLGRKLADLTARNEERYQVENELDSKVHQLSGILDVRVTKDSTNQYTITTQNFQVIYSPAWELGPNQVLNMLEYPASASVAPGQVMSSLMLRTHPDAVNATVNIEGSMSSGEYGGLRKVNEYMVDFQSHLDEFTEKFATSLNNAHCLGTSKAPPSTHIGAQIQPGIVGPLIAGSTLTTSGFLRLGVMDKTTGQLVSFRDIDLSNPITVGAISDAGELITELSNGTGVTATITANGELRLDLMVGNPNHGIVMGRVTGQNPPLVEGGGVAPPVVGPNTAEFQIFFGLNRLVIPSMQKIGGSNAIQVRSDVLTDENRLSVGKLLDEANPVGKNAVPMGDLSIRTQMLDGLKNTPLTFSAAGTLSAGTKTLSEYADEIIGRQSSLYQLQESKLESDKKTYDQLAKTRKEKDGIDPKKVFTDITVLAQSRQLAVKAMRIILSMLGEVLKLMD